MKNERAGKAMDAGTAQYIRNIKRLQLMVLLVIVAAFMIFGHTVIVSSNDNLEKVALAEVKESMQETVNNIALHIDEVKLRMEAQAASEVAAWKNVLLNNGVKNAEDLFDFLNAVHKEKSTPAVEAV